MGSGRSVFPLPSPHSEREEIGSAPSNSGEAMHHALYALTAVLAGAPAPLGADTTFPLGDATFVASKGWTVTLSDRAARLDDPSQTLHIWLRIAKGRDASAVV